MKKRDVKTDLKTLRIDEKFTIMYNPAMNCAPVQIRRHGELWRFGQDMSNLELAMFYALLEIENG